MLEKLLKNHKFQIVVGFAGVIVLGLTIADKIMSIRQHKLEIANLKKDEN